MSMQMFSTQGVPCYIAGMIGKRVKVGKEKFKGIELTLRIDPFTPELASEIGDIKSKLFKRHDASVDPNVDSATFTFKPKTQYVEIKPEPALSWAPVKIQEAKVTKFRVRRPADGTQWVLVFKVAFAESDANDLLYLKDALFETRFFSFADSQGGLFADAEAEAARDSKEAKPVKKGHTEERDEPLPMGGDQSAATH